VDKKLQEKQPSESVNPANHPLVKLGRILVNIGFCQLCQRSQRIKSYNDERCKDSLLKVKRGVDIITSRPLLQAHRKTC
jgi:hypothetical protein